MQGTEGPRGPRRLGPGEGPPELTRGRRRIVVVLVALVAALLIVPRFVAVYTDWLWFGEVGFRQVWGTVLVTRLLLFVVVTGLVAGPIFLAVMLAYRARPIFAPRASQDDPVASARTTAMRRPKTYAAGVALLLGIPVGLAAQANWTMVHLFLHGGSFGATDAEFGHDIGFYVFDLPFYRSVLNWLFLAVFFAFCASLATHALFGGVRLPANLGRSGDRSRERSFPFTRAAGIQLTAIAGTFILLKAVAYWLDRYSLLWSGRKEPTFTGAGFTDITAVLPARTIMFAIAVLCALAFFATLIVRDLRLPAMALSLLVLSSVLVGGVWPLTVEQFSVRPNAADRESPYIERNIEATRQAYRIGDDRVHTVDYPGIGTRPPREVPADATTLANVRILDPTVLSRTFTQQQQLKNFYGFTPTLDVDRYEVNGELRDYVVAVRELSPGSLSGNQTQWVNRHSVYTHGNGFVAAPANRVNAAVRDATDGGAGSDSGYPIYAVSDIASQATGRQLIPVEQPRVYYGELIAGGEADYAIVGGEPGEPPREYDTDTSQYTYTGSGGVPVGNWLNRLAFAARYTERNILFSGVIGSESKIIFNRDPRQRVEMVAPWLTTDGNPYPAVVDGRIVWIVDGYTTLDHYPYAQRSVLTEPADPVAGTRTAVREVSYVRNSVKATVDAYDGTVTLYQNDTEDPVLDAWMKAFPGTVQPEDTVSDELRAHFRYPEDVFRVQRQLLAKYHVDDPREFFTNNAFWSVPSDPTVEANPTQPPYYVLLGDRETTEPSFRLVSAMVGFNREFLSAYLSVESDPENYGRIEALRLPTDTQTQGPQQTQNSMISDTRVASERTLLERSNRIHYGNLLTLPISDGGILYVEPLYTERLSAATNGSTFPQLSRMLVSYREPGTGGVRVGYAPTLAEALDQVFGGGTGRMATPPGGDAAPQRELPAEAMEEAAPDAASPQDGTEAPTDGVGPPVPAAPTTELAAAARELETAMASARDAQHRGDFTAYGIALDRLQRAIDAYLDAGG
ncbi:COG1615 family transporter [Rhodococcus triatomae]|uniref:UPF0182 protein SAMN05444695_10582 n=1 Tax=Rhodococcus triatomae TaxID=300028 RepID=A0A1G8HVW0_9NOCA|nr:UPF0182 family protein [Rhodococcus triatomae]QNG20894.1 COG1615 family transporter [Rhodococcus triatomae]QNG23191.1 COG1615 family transporter [Rhodococcus triatomae]SDI10773.1 hypothetical protein SAMN05444695_10582 [Rhodococcus triatomae]